jgi:hypothetical protein
MARAATSIPARVVRAFAAHTGDSVNPAVDLASSDAVRAYAEACRARVPAFVARHFGWRGSLRLHASALGLDLLRAPFNVLLVGPTLFLKLAAQLCRWLGWQPAARWLATRNLFVETDMARRLADLVLRELLQADAPGGAWPGALQDRIRDLIAEYLTARNAVAEFAAGFVAIAAGLILVQALTPSAITLGPLLAREFAQREAIEGFWLGPGLGAIWHGWFPAHAGWVRTIATTMTVMGCFAILATFMGLVTDPLLQALGVHRRRLRHLIDTMERAALGDGGARLGLPDLYVARITDLADVVLLALRMTR